MTHVRRWRCGVFHLLFHLLCFTCCVSPVVFLKHVPDAGVSCFVFRVSFFFHLRLWYDEIYTNTRSVLLNQLKTKGKLSLTSATMSLLTELRQSCDHPQLVSRQHRLLGVNRMSKGRMSLQTLLLKLLKKSMAKQGLNNEQSKIKYLMSKGEQYGLNLTNGGGVFNQMATDNDQSPEDDEMLTCSICLDQPEVMSIAKCGHTYCKSCIERWMQEHTPHLQKSDRFGPCPTCRKNIHACDLEEYSKKATLDSQNTLKAMVEDGGGAEQLSHSDYGSKVTTVMKTMLRLSREDPSSKFVIFSQWQDMLDLTESALVESNMFSCVQFKGGDQAAQDDLNRFLTPYEEVVGGEEKKEVV